MAQDNRRKESDQVSTSKWLTYLAGAAVAGGVGYALYRQLKNSKVSEASNKSLSKDEIELKDPESTEGGNSVDLRIPYATPSQAFLSNSREKILFVTATRTPANVCSHVNDFKPSDHVSNLSSGTKQLNVTDEQNADFIAVVDVDPNSPNYCKIIDELPLGNNLELHHFGWNSCAGCLCNDNVCDIKQRRFLIAPAFATGDVFIIDTTDYKNIKLHKKIPGEYLRANFGVSWPHTSHCLADGTVMMSFLGFDKKHDDYEDSQWLVFDGRDESFKCLGPWINKNKENTPKAGKDRYSYDFWYQPYHNIMISSEWGDPNAFSNGFNPKHVGEGLYGHSIHLWDWKEHKLIKTINFEPSKVTMALETRFLHNPRSSHAFINGALSSNIIHVYLDENTNEWIADESYIQVNGVNMKNWILPTMPGLITDILISMDDKYLYFANWLHGDVRQYDISDPMNPKLSGQVFVGGLLRKDNVYGYQTENNDDQKAAETPLLQDNKFIEGGPQMMQLSLDGKRLYVTNSLFSPFDEQFYPSLVQNGGMIIMIDVDHVNGGLSLNTDFCIDFGKDTKSGVPARPHEMRYPGGDCTSDIFIDMPKNATKAGCCGCD